VLFLLALAISGLTAVLGMSESDHSMAIFLLFFVNIGLHIWAWVEASSWY
jgi:uncharacterized membrane protein